MKKLFIHGSCISRDIFRIKTDQFQVEEYVARSCISSVISPAWPVNEDVFSDLQSQFQKRMLMTDFNKLLFKNIFQTKFDYYLIDFIDERFNLVKSDKRIVTKSAELINSNFLRRTQEKISEIKRLDYPLLQWQKDCYAYVKKIKELIPEEKIIIVKGFWAEKYVNLEKEVVLFDGYKGFHLSSIRKMNQLMNSYYDFLYSLLPHAILINFPDPIADENHRWGLSPFHYIESQYLMVYQALNKLT